MLAQAGATPDLVACMVSETSKKRPADRIVEGCCFLLEAVLNDLRIAGVGGTPQRVHPPRTSSLPMASAAP